MNDYDEDEQTLGDQPSTTRTFEEEVDIAVHIQQTKHLDKMHILQAENRVLKELIDSKNRIIAELTIDKEISHVPDTNG